MLDVLDESGGEADLYRVRSEEDPSPRLMRFFAHGVEPESRIYPAITGINTPRLASLAASGRTEGRAFEVWDDIDGETLAATLDRPFSPHNVREIVRQVDEAITALESRNLRHGNLNPCAIRFRSLDPIDVQVGELSTATLSEFRLETARVRSLSRYVSPESMVGASSQASDWWSLGIIVLELLTGGCYFEQVNDRAFLLSVVARSLKLPTDLGADWALLLKGLLTRDHDKRWRGSEVKRWLAGDRDIPVHFEIIAGESDAGPTLSLGGQPYRDTRTFALAAAQAENWEEALALTEMGSVASWLAAIGTDSAVVRRFEQLMEERRLERDYRFALALLCLNEHLPLSLRGDIQTPNRFLERPEEAEPWLEKVSVNALTQLGREAWIVRMAERAARIRARAEELDITLVEARFRVAQLAAFESRLTDFWRQRQRLFPDSTIPGLAALLERRILTDEDLILLICADDLSFRSCEQVVAEAKALADKIGAREFAVDKAREDCALSKRVLIDRVKERVGAFKRTDREPLNEWADILRLGRRLPLDRLLILHAMPESVWKEPPHQDYLRNVLEFLQKKIVSNLQRGPLLKLMIGRSASRLDVTELGDQGFVKMLVERVLSLNDQPVSLSASETIEAHELIDKLRRISKATDLYRRETGVSALVLAFPLITFDDESLTGASSIRIAPLALWPVKIGAKAGHVSISYDGERDVELNPALKRVLGATTASAWREKFEFITSDGVQSIAELIEAFGGLTSRADPLLRPIPNQSEIKSKYQPELVAAGALILADFPSQSIVEDLRTILAKPMKGSVLPYLLRIAEPKYCAASPRPAEEQRFTTLEADPSQEQAVLAARQVPGVKLEGPPGTGKSQTIVNVIADCMGRGESVMLVCEKQVALEVVYKRLEAEGLGGRVVRIENTQTDRKRLLEQLQNQIPQALQTPVSIHNEIHTQRRQTAAAIDQLEEELSRYHAAVYDASQRLGLSYRDVVARIAAHEQAAKGLSAPTLRPVLGALEPAQVEKLVGECLGLLEVWYQVDFTDDTLALFRKFETDPALEERLTADLRSAELAESERRAALEIAGPMTGLPANADSSAIALWRRDHERILKALSPQARDIMSGWRNVLEPRDAPASASLLRGRLEQLINRLGAIIPDRSELAVYAPLATAAEEVLVALETHASLFSANRSLLAKLNPLRAVARRKVRNILQTLRIPVDDAVAATACTAAGKEHALRQARGLYEGVREILGLKTDVAHLSSAELRDDAKNVASWLDYAMDTTSRILVSVWPGPLWHHLSIDNDEWANAFVRMAAAEDLLRGTQRARAIFASISSWIEPVWLKQRYDELNEHKLLSIDFIALFEALQRLTPYQIFRRTELSEPATAVFTALLALREKLCRFSPEDRSAAIEALIRREAAYAWAEEIRQERPILAQPPEMTERKVDQLRLRDQTIRALNKQVLGIVDAERLAPIQRWSQIWQIGGINAQRLRQVFASGRDLGLLAVRPVWLVSPDVVSRIFPLEPGLFDVVIFDEASQMRVENAVAALYRAKRAIISGDSKQLPPTKFFASSVSDDDEIDLEELTGEDADSEIADLKREETAKRRHVKDCPDLLKLSEGVLPEQPLVIHYRSAYRELIDFSNAAYYGGQLNVPVRRPITDVRRHRPIEVRRIDGVYGNQTNKAEAKAVVDYLAEIWRKNAGKLPTVGVVTFNLKQAELIDQAVQEMARHDRTFRMMLEREQVRKLDGEDVSFFVRNLENVQGDERDQIIFSTTFGKDGQGRFKRSFGVLTQEGGERRLNVAVTRAKTKVVLMTSMPTDKISEFPNERRSPTKARDYLGAYLRYAEYVHDGELDAATELLASFNGTKPNNFPPARENDSDALVQTIRDVLESKGHKTVLLPAEDAFSVDVAVVHPKTKLYSLGVELDGPRHHILNSARARDLWRPKILERSGMQVHRVYSAAWASSTAHERRRLLEAAKKAEERAI